MKATLLLVFIAVALLGCGTTQPASLKEPRILHTLKAEVVRANSVAWSPDSMQIVIGSFDNSVSLWNASSGEKLASFEGHKSAVKSVTWSPDGKRIASGSEDKTVNVWNSATGEKLHVFTGHTNYVNSVQWSPDGKAIASGGHGGHVKIWDAESGKELQILKQSYHISSLAWSPSGRHLATGSGDRTVHIWDVASGKDLIILKEHGDDVQDVAWSPDGTRVISGVCATYEDAARVWDVISRKVLLSNSKGFGACVTVSPDGGKIASGGYGKTISIWNSTNGKVLQTLEGHTLKKDHDSIWNVAWSPNGKAIVSSTRKGEVIIWSIPK
jgi:WD40 repeat protein